MGEQLEPNAYIIFKETTFEEYNGIEGAEIQKGKWGFVKLSKDKMEQIRQNKEPTPILGIRFKEPMPEDPDYCEYRLISVSEDELVLVPQMGFTTNYYKKVK
ncbi:MAG: hypothetical protein EAZ06_08975 [Cytophagales bacterium]|nr:MAG: hypothetical protein EAZ06_08975 [Cytophagales bacterium]